MPIRIERQQEMKLAREAVTFCYLCGKPLDDSDPSELAVEHVVARKSIESTATNAEAWPVTLVVHASCDRALKKPHDDEFIALQRCHTRPLHQVSKHNRATVRKMIRKADSRGVPQSLSAVDGKSIIRVSKAIVQGMHAALYAEYLPRRVKSFHCAPVPGFDSRSRKPVHSQLARSSWMSDKILMAVASAIMGDEWDGVTAWGGAIRYRCIWHIASETRDSAVCFWMLDTPEAMQWSEVTVGEPCPWRGVYKLPTLPTGASVLGDRSIEAFVAESTRVQNKVIIGTILNSVGRTR